MARGQTIVEHLSDEAGHCSQSDRPIRAILLSVACTALTYVAVGMPLGVLPTWLHRDLGYDAAVAGGAVSIQYVATIISRAMVGPMADRSGPRRSILIGFACCIVSGVMLMCADRAEVRSGSMIALLLASRIMLGFGESLVSTSAIAWSIARAGVDQTTRIISWNGIATYGALALGAPIGVWLFPIGGVAAIGIATALIGIAGLAFTLPQAATRPIPATRLPFTAVFMRVLPYGSALGLGAIGFGVVATFTSLVFTSRGWAEAWIALTGFGGAFVLARLLCTGLIATWGGRRTSAVFLAIEAAGLATMWLSPVGAVAIAGAAMAGFGFSLLFPALGVIVVDLVPPQSRGTAIGTYSLFTDVALCVTGPLAGLLASHAGYEAPFLLGAVASTLALALLFVTSMISVTRPEFKFLGTSSADSK
jgi:MFS family permease